MQTIGFWQTICLEMPENLVKIATRAAIYRSLRTLWARNRKKVSKKVFFGGSGEKSQKIPERYKNTDFRTFLGVFRYFKLKFRWVQVRQEKGTQTQTFGSGYPAVGWGSSTSRGGGPKVRYVSQNQGNQIFLAGCPAILPRYPGGARKV